MSSEKLLRRIILFRFKGDASKEQIDEVGKAFLALPDQVKTIKDIEWGNAVHNPESYTHCLLVTFQTEVDMQAYEDHPAHIAIGEKYGHLVQDLAGLDYWSKE
jgi:hypothetical protein